MIVVLHEIIAAHAQLRLQTQLQLSGRLIAKWVRLNDHVHVIDETKEQGIDGHVYLSVHLCT